MFAVAIVLQFAFCSCAKKEVIVYPSILEERMTGSKLVVKITEDIMLNLERSSVLADELVFVTSSKEKDIVETVSTSIIQKHLYQDTHRQSSVMVHNIKGAVQVEGVLGSELRIKPLLEAQRSLEGQIPHMIYEVEERANSIGPGIAHAPRSKTGPRKTIRSNKTVARNNANPRAKEETFVVEIHIISDNEHQHTFKKNQELIAYLAIMTNAVNLRYLDMSRPKVKFILVGITRSKDDAFLTTVEGFMDADSTLRGLVKYKKDGKVPGNADILFLVTGMDMAKKEAGGELKKSVNGLAFIGTVCRANPIGEGEDTATSYSGVHTMAHELCHVMGSNHDESPECPWEEGYLMSYVDGGLKRYRPSPCSEKAMREVYKKLPPQCKEVQAKRSYMDEYKQFPGQTVRERHYCNKITNHHGKKGYIKKTPELSKQCKMQCCYRTTPTRSTCWKVSILSGMTCEEGKTCKRGVCGIHNFP